MCQQKSRSTIYTCEDLNSECHKIPVFLSFLSTFVDCTTKTKKKSGNTTKTKTKLIKK